MALSIVAIIYYAIPDVLGYSENRPIYLFYLLYFHLPGASNEGINWGKINDFRVEPRAPETQISGVLRTFVFSVLYLSLNLLLFIFVFRTIGEHKEDKINNDTLNNF